MRVFPRLSDLAEARGESLGTSKWVQITQQMIDDFAEVTGDNQWIHTDPVRTKHELNMPTIAHGYLTVSMVPRFTAQLFSVESVKRIINYGTNKTRFTAMVPVDSYIRGTAVLSKAVLSDATLRAAIDITIEMKGSDKPVAITQTITLMYE